MMSSIERLLAYEVSEIPFDNDVRSNSERCGWNSPKRH